MNEQLRSDLIQTFMLIFMVGFGALIKTFNPLIDVMQSISLTVIIITLYLWWKHKNE